MCAEITRVSVCVMVGEGGWVRLPKVDFCGEGVWVILGKVEGVRKARD